jgi:hypothetical protein
MVFQQHGHFVMQRRQIAQDRLQDVKRRLAWDWPPQSPETASRSLPSRRKPLLRPQLINCGERYRAEERISSALVEATVNAVISKRFAKKQQMQWARRGAHLPLQPERKTLDGPLRSTFKEW